MYVDLSVGTNVSILHDGLSEIVSAALGETSRQGDSHALGLWQELAHLEGTYGAKPCMGENMNWIKKIIYAPRNYCRARRDHKTALADNAYAMSCLRDFLNGTRSREGCRKDLEVRLKVSGGYFDKNGELIER